MVDVLWLNHIEIALIPIFKNNLVLNDIIVQISILSIIVIIIMFLNWVGNINVRSTDVVHIIIVPEKMVHNDMIMIGILW